MIEKIVSGGQTGVDRAALDVAIKLGIPHGGWCPKGRLAEDGTIPEEYQLKETNTPEYSERTCLNIRDADATLILVTSDKIVDGTLLTVNEAKEKIKPYLLINLSREVNFKEIASWMKQNQIKTLNVAGPRESNSPGVYEKAFFFLLQLVKELVSENFIINKDQIAKKSTELFRSTPIKEENIELTAKL